MLEPYEGKLSRTVLRGESSRKGADLLDINDALLKIGAMFRILRRKAGLTQRAVSKDTGFNIGHIEAGKKNINITTLEYLCNYYGLTLKEFFDDINL